jgi:hypothetical protein
VRTYGRVESPPGARFWVEVGPDPNGFLDSIYLTALCQVLKLNYGESPFYGDWGLPALQSVMTQIAPDYYVALTQQRFAPYFLYLGVVRLPTPITPTYNVSVMFQSGAQDSITVIPQAMVDGFGQPVVDGHGVPVSTGLTTSGRFVAQ